MTALVHMNLQPHDIDTHTKCATSIPFIYIGFASKKYI